MARVLLPVVVYGLMFLQEEGCSGTGAGAGLASLRDNFSRAGASYATGVRRFCVFMSVT